MNKLSLTETLSLLSLYLIAVGLLYEWGYWSVFSVNFMSYLSFSDVLKLALIPVVRYTGFLVIGIAIYEILWGRHTQVHFPPGGGRDTPIGRFLVKHKELLGVLYLASLIVVVVFGRSPLKWMVASAMVAPFIVPFLRKLGVFSSIEDARLRETILFVLVLVAGYGYTNGNLAAQALFNIKKATCVELKPGIVSGCFRLEGVLTGTYFLLMPDGRSTLVARAEDVLPLKIPIEEPIPE
jgi:hypothetical protein